MTNITVSAKVLSIVPVVLPVFLIARYDTSMISGFILDFAIGILYISLSTY